MLSNAQNEVDYRLAKWIVRNMEKEQFLTPDEVKTVWQELLTRFDPPPGALRRSAKPSEAVRLMAKRVTLIEPTAALPESPTDVSRGREKVAAYARVSTGNEDQATSLVAQTDYYRKKIQGNPAWDFVGIYADDGVSGTSYMRREGFNSMLSRMTPEYRQQMSEHMKRLRKERGANWRK